MEQSSYRQSFSGYSGCIQESISRLEEVYNHRFEDIVKLLQDIAKQKSVSEEKLYLLTRSIVVPVDGKRFPKSWLTPRRISRVLLEELGEVYWNAIQKVDIPVVGGMIAKWNQYTSYSESRWKRICGEHIRLGKIYLGSRWLKDIWVWAEKQYDIIEVVKDAIPKLDDVPKKIYPWIWKWYHRDDGENKSQSKLKVIEI